MHKCFAGVVLSGLLLLAAPAAAQLDTATVIGSVNDAQDAAVPGVNVTAKNVGTGFTRFAITDGEGRYRVAALPPGSYELRAELPGFATVIRNGVTLAAGSQSVLNFSLAPATVTESITVTAEVPVVQTTTSSIEMGLTRREIELLPLIGRSYVSLLRLAPTAASNNSSYGFGGSRARSNQWFVDGLENSEDISGYNRTDPVLDAIQEVQLVVNGFKAEYGQASGGVVNVITKSGTNTPHGSGFFLFRNQDLIARDPYAEEKDQFRRIHYGGTAGGPLKRDKVHFFAAYEREDRDTFAISTRVLPAASANFAPSTLQYLSQSNIPLSLFGAGGRVRHTRPEYIDRHRLSVRFDDQVNRNQALTFKYTLDADDEPAGRGGTLFDYNGSDSSDRQNDVAATHKWVVAPNKLNEAYVHVGQEATHLDASFPKLMNVSVSGGFDLGGGNFNPLTNYIAQLVDNFSWTTGRTRTGDHVLKAGAQVKIFRSDSYFDSNFRGTFTFPDLNAFIQGRPSRFTQNQGDSRLARPNNIFGFYFQDDWRPAKSLTFNLGLRYDYENAKTEALRNVNADGSPGPGISGDTNNLAPRFGFAWAPGQSTKQSFYGGTGVYYDQIILNIIGNARFTPPKVIGIQIDNPSWPDPFAGGTVRIPPTSVSIIDPNLVTPYNWNSQVGFRRELLTDVGLDVSFVYNRGYDHVGIVNANAGLPGTANLTGGGAVRPDPNFTNKSFYTNYGRIWYKGMVVDLRKRFSDRFQANVSYTLSSTVNNTFNFVTSIQVPTQPDLSVGPDAQDRRHRLEAHAEIVLPWQIELGAIAEFRSQAPIDVFAGGRDLNGDGITGDWVNERLCVNISCPGFTYTRNSVRELSTAEANRLRALFGLAPIEKFEDNPRYVNVDLTAQKRITFGRHAARLRLEAFNLFNIPQRGYTTATSTNVNQNIISSLFGQYTFIHQPRAIQLTFGYGF